MTDLSALDATLVSLNPQTQLALSGVLAVMMFSVALTLKPADFGFLKSRPKTCWGRWEKATKWPWRPSMRGASALELK